MSKQKKDLVWELVQALSKAEKRQFKLYAQRMERNENSKFIALFDLLNKSDCYDEAKILHKKIVTKNQLSNLNYNCVIRLIVRWFYITKGCTSML